MLDLTRLKLYCKDEFSKIENYELAKADNFEGWVIHHRLELTLDRSFAHSRTDLIRLGMYYHRPYFELIFLSRAEHARLHNKGKTFTEEHRQKLSLRGKEHSKERGKKIAAALKGKTFTAEHKQKLSEARKASWARRNSLNQQAPIDELI